jgi:hypothetical protein
VLSFSPS